MPHMHTILAAQRDAFMAEMPVTKAVRLDRLKRAGFQVAALTTDPAARPLHRFSARGERVALLAGAEGTGLSESAVAAADVQLTIPMSGRVDSLNVSTAVAVALYHVSLD